MVGAGPDTDADLQAYAESDDRWSHHTVAGPHDFPCSNVDHAIVRHGTRTGSAGGGAGNDPDTCVELGW